MMTNDFRDHTRRGHNPLTTQGTGHRFDTRRTSCPACGSSDGFAAILGYQDKGKCHSCGKYLPPERSANVTAPLPADSPAILPPASPAPSQQLFISMQDVEKTMGYLDHVGLEFYYDRYARIERAAIYEYVAGFSREQADVMAGITVDEHRNDGSFEACVRELAPRFPFAARLMEITRSLSVLSDCLIGLGEHGATIYWYRDINDRIVNGKRIIYNGFKRDKLASPPCFVRSSAHGYGLCLFGEEQLAPSYMKYDMTTFDTSSIVYLVESEKTAVIGRYVLPQFIWLATGGASGLSRQRAEVLHGRRVRILFDQDEAGQKGAEQTERVLRSMLIDAGIMDLSHIVSGGTGFDLADHYDRTTPNVLSA